MRSAAPLERLAVVNAQAPDFDEFLRLVDDVRSTKPVVVGEIGPVIGTHAGPGTIGVAWVSRASLKAGPLVCPPSPGREGQAEGPRRRPRQ